MADDTPRTRTLALAQGEPLTLYFSQFALEVVEGPDAGLRQVFGQPEVDIGTAKTNHFILSDKTVSHFHAKICAEDANYVVIDQGSTNGTFVGSTRVRNGYLDANRVITLGQSRIRFAPVPGQAKVELAGRHGYGEIIGSSTKMQRLYELMERVADSDASVIITGETGTGKDLVARTIHQKSPRAQGPFEVLDCTAIPDNLVESELFGHVKGSFTGAERDRPGIFERARGGTVFLDELGELKTDLQPKLLRVLENAVVRRVGGEKVIPVDVRVIAATHRSLRELVNQGQFREDLYYRLSVCELNVPPLRERADDIPLLVQHFVQRRGGSAVPAGLVEGLRGHRWPGNVRQLRNAVERILIMGNAPVEDAPRLATPAPSAGVTGDMLAHSLKDAKDAFERAYLVRLLERYTDLDEAARAADLHPKSLARLLRRYDIGRSQGE